MSNKFDKIKAKIDERINYYHEKQSDSDTKVKVAKHLSYQNGLREAKEIIEEMQDDECGTIEELKRVLNANIVLCEETYEYNHLKENKTKESVYKHILFLVEEVEQAEKSKVENTDNFCVRVPNKSREATDYYIGSCGVTVPLFNHEKKYCTWCGKKIRYIDD